MKVLTKVFWLFGRSGAGKTTLGRRLREGLADRNIPVVYLDGDELRSSLCSDLGFGPEARLENHRRIAQMAKLLAGQDLTVVVSTMAPEYPQRDMVTQVLGERLVWIYIDAPLDACMARDPKGIYKRAQAGQLKQLIDYPFDAPRPHEGKHRVDTIMQDVDQCYQVMLAITQSELSDFAI
ncbi:MAG: adenylyl-sulfate kinase [Verrucomicrobiae bacterium]|nr:adenylyl-sulfate kinase [Verrucomicrobiae bacterium]